MRVHQNIVLVEYFKNRAKDPHGLLTKLKEIHEQGQSGENVARAASNFSLNAKLPPQSQQISDINSILLYNIATLSYQTQTYGQSLIYLKLILENMDQVEEFIQIKSLFLILQILFELKMPSAV